MPFIFGPQIADFFTNDMNPSFDHLGDQMPIGREKLVHPQGVVAKVAFIPEPDTKYTGMFKEVQQHGILRLSNSVKADPSLGQQFIKPGMALKFLRDGMHAADTVTLVSADIQPTFNFFKHRYTTALTETDDTCFLETVGKKSAEATDYIGNMSLMDWGQYDSKGNEEDDNIWPFAIDFEGINDYGWTDEYQESYID